MGLKVGPVALPMGKVSSQYGARFETMRASHGEKDAIFSKRWDWQGEGKNAGTFVALLQVLEGMLWHRYLVNARAGSRHTSFDIGSGVNVGGQAVERGLNIVYQRVSDSKQFSIIH